MDSIMRRKNLGNLCACFLLLIVGGSSGVSFAQNPKATAQGAVTSKPVSSDAVTSPPHAALHWVTQSEEDNHGFLIKRSELEKGPFKFITSKIISGHGNTSTPHDYNYLDYDVQPGKTYFYQLYTVSYQGQQAMIGQQIRFKVKNPDEK